MNKLIEGGNKHYVLLIFIIILVLYVPSLNNRIDRNEDAPKYIILAESIAKDKSFSHYEKPEKPPHILEPFMFPLMISPLVYFFPNNFLIYKLIPLICSFFFFFLLLFIFFKNEKNKFLILFLSITSLIVITASTMVLTEMPYMFFSILALIFLFRYDKNNKNLDLIMGIILMLLAYYTRSNGVALFMAAIVYFFFSKKIYKSIIIFLSMIIGVLPWMIRNFLLSDKANVDYISTFLLKDPWATHLGNITLLDFINRVFFNIIHYIYQITPSAIFFSFFTAIDIFNLNKILPILIMEVIVGIIIFLVTFYGFFKKLINRISILELYIIFYYLILVIYTNSRYPRFLIPIIPFLIYYFVIGLRDLINHFNFSKNYKRIIFYFIIFLMIFGNIISDVGYAIRQHNEDNDYKNFYKACGWVKDNTKEDDIIVSRSPYTTYFCSGNRKSLGNPLTNNITEIMSFFYLNDIDYIIVDAFSFSDITERYLKPSISQNIDKFDLVYKTEKPYTYVYKLKK